MLRKTNWLIWFGVTFILAGNVYFWNYFQKHAPSPFDLVDEDPAATGFLPVLIPVSNEVGEKSEPTHVSLIPDFGLEEIDSPIDTKEAGLEPDHLVIPSISLDAPIIKVHYKDIHFGGQIYHQWNVPAEFAVGWQDESALLGLPGNTVLNGHHNAYGMVFKDLVKLMTGDLIIVSSGEVEFRYIVATTMRLPERDQTLEVRMENARWLAQSGDERLTLITCWPADSNTHRVIIVAFPEK